MPVSPICLVADGLGPFVPTTGGVDVGPADTISIKLNDTTGVANWFLLVSGTDELSTPPTLTSVNPITNQVATPGTTVTFSYPNAQGRAILFTSTVTGPGGPVTTTFCIYSRTIGGKRVGAAGEEREGSTSFGWITILNPIIRVGASYLYYDDTLQAPASGSNTIQGVIDYLKTHGGGVTSVTGTAPIGSTGGTTPVISIAPATDLAAGSMSAADKTKLDGITAGAAVASVSGSSPIASSGGTTPTISFSIAGQAQGDVIYFDGANWVRLPAGTLGQFLETLGPGANPQWATASGGSSGPLGDNADAFRAGPFRNFLQGQVTAPQLVLNTGLLDEFDILSTTKSGSDLVLSGRRLFFAGTIAVAPQLMSGSSSVTASPTKIAKATASLAGAATVAADAYGPLTNAATQASGAESLASSSISASASVTHNASASLQGAATVTPGGQIYVPSNNITNAQLYSMDLGGYATAPEFNQTSQISLMKNPSALVGLYVNSRNFQALSVSSAGVLSNTFYDTIHSRSTDWTIKHTAPESWAGSRACYVYQDFGNGVLTTFFWTVPGGNKVYADNVSEEGLQTSLNIVASNPTGICADGSNNVWVSFVGLGRVRKYTVGQGPLTYFQLTQVLDITLANVVELMFDGKYIWALSTAGANGTIYKLDQSTGTTIGSYAFASGTIDSTSRMCCDGVSVWVTAGAQVHRMFSEGANVFPLFTLNMPTLGLARGIVADRDGTIYIAVYNTANLFIYAWYPTMGNEPEGHRKATVWQTGGVGGANPTFVNAIQIPIQGKGTRTFEMDVTATTATGQAAWKQSFTVNDNDGTAISLIGSPSDMVSPRLNGIAITNGWSISVAIVSTPLGNTATVQINQGTTPATTAVSWAIDLKESHSYTGAVL